MKIVSAEKKIVTPLIEICTETVEEVKLAKITLAEINLGGIGAYFVYFHWYLKKDVTRVEFDTRTQTIVY